MDEKIAWWLILLIPPALFGWGIATGIWHTRERRAKAWISTALGLLLAGVPVAYFVALMTHEFVEPPLSSEVFDQGYGYSRSYLTVGGQNDEALDVTIKAAQEGDLKAQERLGDNYANGQAGASRDIEEAIRWYTLAAKRGSVHARLELVEIFDSRESGKHDQAAALYWYEELANAGDAQSQGVLGYRYGTGDRAPKDLNKSAYWLEKAALAQETQAQYYLARMYELGQGRDKNLVEALAWYLLASSNGDKKAFERQQHLQTSMDAFQQSKSFQLAAARLAAYAQSRNTPDASR